MSTTINNPWSYQPGPGDHRRSYRAVIAARKFVKPSGNRTSGGNLAVAQAAAGDRPLGVSADDATAAGQLVRIARGGIAKVVAAGAIAAGASVQVGAGGAAATASTGVVVGLAVTGAADGAVAEIAGLAMLKGTDEHASGTHPGVERSHADRGRRVAPAHPPQGADRQARRRRPLCYQNSSAS